MTMPSRTQRRRTVQKLAHVAFVMSIGVADAARHLPQSNPSSRFGVHKSHILVNLRGGAIDDSRRPPPPSRYSSNYDDVGRYDAERRDNPRRRSFDEYDDRVRSDGRRSAISDDRNADNDESNKSKGWFGRSKEDSPPDDTAPIVDQGNPWNTGGATGMPPPPPPPPPSNASGASSNIAINPAETERTPIHYQFPSAEVAADERRERDTKIEPTMNEKSDDPRDSPDIPFIEEDDLNDRDRTSRRRRRRSDDEDDRYSSARRDAVTTYMSTKRGAIKVRLGSVIVGAAIGSFMGKSLLNDPVFIACIMSATLLVAGFLRNDYGELSRALGLAFILTLKRTTSVRKDFPTLVHIKAMIGQGPRKPFPPVEEESSPWRYEPIYEDDPDFKMTYVLLAMALVGSFCGGNVPLLPQWLGGIIGAVAFASFTQGSNAQGDLGRTMGMRLVALVQVVTSINSELRILGKAATVGGLIFDKMMIFDRKHRVKDKFVALCRFAYDKVARTADLVQDDMSDERRDDRRDDRRDRPPRRDFDDDDRRGRPPNRDRDRRRDFEEDDRRGRPPSRDRDRDDDRREPRYRRR